MTYTYRYDDCPSCNVFADLSAHVCAPRWEWRCDHHHAPDEWSGTVVRAYDAEAAATAAAEVYDKDDYPILRGNDAVIWVRREGETEASRWAVYAESVPTYYARSEDVAT